MTTGLITRSLLGMSVRRPLVRRNIGTLKQYSPALLRASYASHNSSPAKSDESVIEGDDRLCGDYPDYPYVSNQKRDPSVKYDYQQLRRNFGDPLHENDDNLNMWSPDIHDYVSDRTAAQYIVFFFLTVAGGAYLASFYALEPIAAPRIYPNGLFKELGGAEYNKNIYVAKKDDGTYY
ncbi:hypothetical protein V1511DRAFT_501943 [Dipodascopsis uninucleata]